jgi:hypothetical protein
MYRGSLALTVVLLVTSVGTANAPPPSKWIPVEIEVTTDKDYPEYDFYLVDSKFKLIQFGPKNPIKLKAKPGEDYDYRLVGVPKGTEKTFVEGDYFFEKDFLRALQKEGGVEGRVQSDEYLSSHERVWKTDKRDGLVLKYKVETIDAKKRTIVLVTKKNTEPKKDSEKKDSPDDDAPGVSAYTPRGGMWVAGTAASLALMLGGLWVAGRGRRAR